MWSRSGNATVNCAVVPAVVPSTVAVMCVVPVVVPIRVVRAMLLPSASITTGSSCPSVARNATLRRPAGRPAATMAETISGVAPSAGTDEGAADTVTICAGSTDVNVMSKSCEMSIAVTRTRAVPMVFSLCSATSARPVSSAVTVTARESVSPVAISVPAEVSNRTARCRSVPTRFSVTVMTAVEKPSAGTDARLTDASNASARVSFTNSTDTVREIPATVTSSWAVPALVELRNSTTAFPLVSAGAVIDKPSLPPKLRVPAVVVNVRVRLSASVRGSSCAVIVTREMPSADTVVADAVTRSTSSAWLGTSR